MASQERITLPITAIWSRCIGNNIETWVEIDREWFRCIVESGDNFSWIAECRGYKRWPKMAPDGEATEQVAVPIASDEVIP